MGPYVENGDSNLKRGLGKKSGTIFGKAGLSKKTGNLCKRWTLVEKAGPDKKSVTLFGKGGLKLKSGSQ